MAKSRFEPSQADNRRLARWRDQHGRLWEGVTDIKNGFPVGPLSLVEIKPPLIPPQKYLRFPVFSDGTLTIDYREWIRDREKAIKTYESRRLSYAQKLYGEQAGNMLKKNPVELQRSVGIDPDPVEPVLAASSGNKWVLGLSDVKPDWAENFDWGPRQSYSSVDFDDDEFAMEELTQMFPDAPEPEYEEVEE